jgi:hypothetical protein
MVQEVREGRERVNLRRGTYLEEYEASNRRQNDRMAHPPKSLLRWLQEGYALEAPAALHTHQLEEDGDPAMHGEARAYIGFSQGVIGGTWFVVEALPNDWRKVANRTDADGYYVTPMRAAIARLASPDERKLLSELATNVLYPLDVCRANGIPDWCRHDVVDASLKRLYRAWRDAPLPERGRISEAQADAEALL